MLISRLFYSTIFYVAILQLGCFDVSFAQLSDDLKQKLSYSDQTHLQKTEETLKKAEQALAESKYLVPKATTSDNQKAEKKYYSKRTEATELFNDGYSEQVDIYKLNFKSFWKKYAGEKSALDSLKTAELAASDSFDRAQKYRAEYKKISRMNDQVVGMQKAELLERKSTVMMQKVLLTYLSWPISYKYSWLFEDDAQPENKPEADTKSATTSQTESATAANTQVSTPGVQVPVPTPKPVLPTNLASTMPVNKPYVTHSGAAEPAKESTPPKTTSSSTSAERKENKTKLVGNDSSLYGKVKVNEEQIDQFNKFLSTTYPTDYEHYVIDFKQLDYSNVEQIRQAWDAYVHGPKAVDSAFYRNVAVKADTAKKDTTQTKVSIAENVPSNLQPAPKQSGTEKLVAANTKTTEKAAKTQTKEVETKPFPKSTEKTVPKNVAVSASTEAVVAPTAAPVKVEKQEVVSTEKQLAQKPSKPTKTKTDKPQEPIIAKTDNVSGFSYRVQVVCCRVQMDQKTLKNIYGGNEKITEVLEDGWYKYSVGEFDTYKKAKRYKESTKIQGAFVVSYLNGKRLAITPAMVRNNQGSMESTEFKEDKDVEFRLQIGASKVKLSDKYLVNMYNGDRKIELLEEDGWYKYSVKAGKTYSEAKEFQKQAEIPGAFVVAYKGKQRLELRTAIKQTGK